MSKIAEVEYMALQKAAPAKKVEAYVKYADKVVMAYEAGKIASHEAGALLHYAETDETLRHPMVREISFLGCDLEDANEYMSKPESECWRAIKQVIKDYSDGIVYPTIFKLSVYYSEIQSGKTTKGYGSLVYKKNGVLVIESGDPRIRTEIERAALTLRDQADDNAFLALLGNSLPVRIGNRTLQGRSLKELLVEPIL